MLRKSSLAIGLACVLVASLLPGGLAQAKPAPEHLKAQTEALDRDGAEVAGKGWPQHRLPNASLPEPVWPGAGSARVQLGVAPRVAGRGTKAGDLPVWVDRADANLSQLTVQVLDRAQLPRQFQKGLMVRLNVPSGAPAGTAKIAVEYNGFRYAFGGDWAARLRLWQVPSCALSTPDGPGCQARPLRTVNDVKAGVLTAQVNAAAETFEAAPRTKAQIAGGAAVPTFAATMVMAAAGSSGPDGDFAATTLSPSSTWSAGGSSGDFSWSYPLRIPPAAGGPSPSITIGYSSSSVDGRSQATNNQPSWLGEGFEYSPGYVERRYVPCGEDMDNNPNNTQKTGDLCWRSDNATMSLNGRGGELIFETGHGWHSRSEDGTRVEKLTGASNGDNDGEYWKATTTDGTQYFFGLHNLPSQSTGTNSALTVPVFGNHVGEPCRQGSFAASSCTQVWRWYVDYVVDVHGNTMSYWYDKEANQYARNNTDSDHVSYDREGVLKRIEYGTYHRTVAEHGVSEVSVAPFAQVVFEAGDRCLTSCWSGSDPVTANWPDTPWDQYCAASATSCPQQYSPTFWTTKRLSKITTKVFDTTKIPAVWQDVDATAFTHSFPAPGDGTHAGLWLDSIVHSGLVGATIALPAVTFEPVSMPNRVLTQTNTTNNWLRMSNIVMETGARIHVDYSLPECTSTSLPSAPHTNTMRCYPVLVPDPADPSGNTLLTEWWHKYVVTHVAEDDVQLANGHQQLSKHTWYEYAGAPAWHFADDDGLSKPKLKTWSQFRGYATVKVRSGNDPAQQTLQVSTFLRGMNGDKLSPSGGTRVVTIPASLGSETVYDEDQFAGMLREQVTYNGVETKPVRKTVNVPWRSTPTASRTINGSLVEARFTNTSTVYTATALGVDGARGWRVGRTVSDFDNTYGTSNWNSDEGDVAVSGDEKCATFSYNRNTAKNLVETVKQATSVALPCGTAPSTVADVVSDSLNFYDGATDPATTPVYGAVSRVDLLKDWLTGTGTVWQTVTRNTFDTSGRPVTATDIKGNVNTTAYTPAVGGPLTRVTTTGPAPFNWLTTADIAPYWGASYKSTDPNGRVTGEAEYDALGRVGRVWRMGWSKAANPAKPSAEYTYTFPAARDNYVSITTRELNAKGNYVTAYQILDGLLRSRQTQSITANGDGNRVVTDTLYDEQGRMVTSYDTHAEPGAPSATLYWVPEWSIPALTKSVYDRASRATDSIFYSGDGLNTLVERWRTTSVFEGDLVKTTPPAGATPTTVTTDIAGHTIAMRSHTTPSGVNGPYDETRYQYNRKDQLTKVIDAAGNEWTYVFDAKGRPTSVTDPDSGTTTSAYNDANELVSTTDARNVTLFHVYDQLGRAKELREGSSSGPLRAEWKYDTLYTGQTGFRGQVTQAIQYEPAGSTNAYKWQVRGMDVRYQPTGMNVVVPAIEAGLSGTYIQSFGYSAYTGAPTSMTYPQAADLPTETITTDYDDVTGLPVRLNTNWTLQVATMLSTWYTSYGEPTLTTKKMPGGVYVDDSITYDTYTRRISHTTIRPETATGTVSDRTYSYDQSGNIKSVDDNPQVGTRDTQCFRYDALVRLTTAWTPRAGVDCNPDPTLSDLGGPAPYWMDWSIDKAGNRLGETSHSAAGDTTRTYGTPTGGAGVVRPHAVTGMTTTAPGQSPVTVAYGYDAAGNTTCRPSANVANNCATGSDSQTLTWDAEGRLQSVISGGNTIEANVYDANGMRVIRRDATGTTLYLPGQEIRRQGGANAATRYYAWGNQVAGSRTSAGLTWLYNDHQGTQEVAVNAATQAVDVRRQTPYGEPRGAVPNWSNSKSFVDGDKDPSGLLSVGARNYDTALGRFISDDPLTDVADSQQMHGYAYANNNPISFSDPTGMMRERIDNSPAACNSEAECNALNSQLELDAANRDIEEAKKAQKQSFTEVLIKEGLSMLLDMLGITDIINCFTKGDLMACGSMILSVLPVGKVFKVAKSIFKAVDRAFSAYKIWKRTIAVAEAVLKKADDVLAMAKSKLDNALSKLGDAAEGKLDDVGDCLRHSFDPDTNVLMADGRSKAIKDIRVGEQVLATDPETGQSQAKTVAHLHINRDSDLTDVSVVDTSTRTTVVLKTTAHHPFWDASRNKWTNAADLTPGDHLLDDTGKQTQQVVAVRTWTGLQEMRDLTVADFHTYYVFARNTPVLVHNNSCLRDNNYEYPKNDGFDGPSVEVELPSGYKFDRYGHSDPTLDRGRYASPAGTPFDMRALPAGSERRVLTTYQVVKPFKAKVGLIRSFYGKIGGGMQIYLPRSIKDLLAEGHIKVVT